MNAFDLVPEPWRLDDPQSALDLWISRNEQSEELKIRVMDWLIAVDDPYLGDRDPHNPAAWAAVPFLVPPWSCVADAYRIVPSDRRIHVDNIGTLSWPL